MIKIFEENTLQQDLDTNQKLYLYFYSTSCGPCKITTPLIEEFGNTTNNIVYPIASFEGEELQKQLNVAAYPSIIVVKNNKVVKGAIGQEEVKKIIENDPSNK